MRWWPVVLLVVCVLGPYSRVMTGQAVPIPDDIFISDLADAEFPARVEAGRLVAAGEAPIWTSRIFTGYPLNIDPISLALFAALPPASALGALLGLLLAMAAVGANLLARQYGASRAGGFLAGFAYAWSGFFVCQLRHLGVLEVVALFPLALFCLERAATGGAPDRAGARAVMFRDRMAGLNGFAALFGLQCLAGFPQSVYIAALVYGALVLVRLLWLWGPDEHVTPALRWVPALTLAGGALAAVAVGTLIGMVGLLPLQELGTVSDRGGGGSYAWATYFNYWPRDFLTFFIPYINGDGSSRTYDGCNSSIFWEDYGYVGLVTVLLALLIVAVRVRRLAVAFWTLTALVAYGMVLGREAPFYRIAYYVLPGFSNFRFPSRFLFVVELALALLGGLGLTMVQEYLTRPRPATWTRWLPAVVGACVAAIVAMDLVYHNLRQNPLVSAGTWLTPPRSATLIRRDGAEGRIFTPGSRQLRIASMASQAGSGDLRPYVRHREFLQPNVNLLFQLDTLDGYAGIAPRWAVDLFGDHNRPGLINRFYLFDESGLRTAPPFLDWLEAVSVRWLILPRLPHDYAGARLQHIGSAPPAEIYRLPGTLPRVRIVTRGRRVRSFDELCTLVDTGALDLHHEVTLHEPEADAVIATLGKSVEEAPDGTARIVRERNTEIVIEAQTPRDALLLLADTFYPGWTATVDGHAVTILRANLAHRAVALPSGTHRVIFAYRPASVRYGLWLTGLGLLLLAAGVIFALRQSGR